MHRRATETIRSLTRAPLAWVWGPVALTLLGSAACLYLDGINRAPRVVLTLETDADYVFVGSEVVLSAQDSSDADGDEITYEWHIEYRPLSGEDGGDIPTPEPCQRSVPPGKYCFVPMAKAIYDIGVHVVDRWGARSAESTREVVVNNRPPTARIEVVSPANEFGEYTVGLPILIYGGESSDPDAGDAIAFHWSVDAPLASDPARRVEQILDRQSVPTEDASEAVFFRLVPDVHGVFTVRLEVSDGSGPESTDEDDVTLVVIDDQPPCVQATDPDHSTGTLIFDRSEVRRLEVTGVLDDLDPYPGSDNASFSWSMALGVGEPFAAISGYHFPYLDLAGEGFELGQVVLVRVQPLDRVERETPGCPEEQLTCGLDCFRWVTWVIEYR